MTFNSYEFIFIFLPIALIIFYSLPNTNLAVLWMVTASLIFYGLISPRFLPLLILSVLVNYSLSLRVKASASKRLWLIVGVCLNFLVLMFCKFTGALPLGISFYTFTQTAYLVDVYRGEPGASGLADYCRYVTFLGFITSGPIARFRDMTQRFSPDYEAIARGLTLFILGLFKKVFIADNLAPVVNALFSASGSLTFIEAWLAAVGYSMQLYFDFSGYSDMALGVWIMFGGADGLVNFASPYKSLSMIDFWRRWHMSLGAWVRDYVYIPLGGSREGEVRRTRNVILAMLFTGLWHGVGWTFLVWGALHGLLLGVNHWWRVHGFRLPVVVSWVLTFVSVVVLWVVFRAESLSEAWRVLCAMGDVRNIALPLKAHVSLGFLAGFGISFKKLIPISNITFTQSCAMVLMASLSTLILPNTSQITDTFSPSKLWAAVCVVMAVIAFYNFSAVSDFLYFQF
ncbi:MAG: MBOAT family protein [Synergistaceae bacterium]|nr:MBOAT family protein [Synergistaceae bacterium]